MSVQEGGEGGGGGGWGKGGAAGVNKKKKEMHLPGIFLSKSNLFSVFLSGCYHVVAGLFEARSPGAASSSFPSV